MNILENLIYRPIRFSVFSHIHVFQEEELSITIHGIAYHLKSLECLLWDAFQPNRLRERETAREKNACLI